jgi:hypothetical protein
MITVTERAAARLQALQATRAVPAGQGVKLVPRGPGRVGLTIAAPETGDEVVRYADRPVLLVDGRLTDALAGARDRLPGVRGRGRGPHRVHHPPPRPGGPGGPGG